MKIFLDGANLEQIKEGVAIGMVDGVTTNPSLIAKELPGARRRPRHLRDLPELRLHDRGVDRVDPQPAACSRRKAGAHVVTIPFAVLEQLMKHPLTDTGLRKFLDDWGKVGVKM